MSGSRCSRCRRPQPEVSSNSFSEWEVLVDDSGDVVGVVCAGCLTGAEQQGIDEDAMVTAMEADLLREREDRGSEGK